MTKGPFKTGDEFGILGSLRPIEAQIANAAYAAGKEEGRLSALETLVALETQLRELSDDVDGTGDAYFNGRADALNTAADLAEAAANPSKDGGGE